MDIGITARMSSNSLDPAELAKRAEELGFESFWLPEHPILPVNTTSRYGGTRDGSIPPSMGDIGDPLIALARASAATSTIKLGTAISLVPEHHPCCTPSRSPRWTGFPTAGSCSGSGRAGCRRRRRSWAETSGTAGGRPREHILAMKRLWTEEEAEFHGRFVDFPAVRCSPTAGAGPPSAGVPGRVCSQRVQAGGGVGRRLDAGAGRRRAGEAGPRHPGRIGRDRGEGPAIHPADGVQRSGGRGPDWTAGVGGCGPGDGGPAH